MTDSEHIVSCECHDSHFLTIRWYGAEDDGYMVIGGQYRPARWKHRLKIIWETVTGKGHMDSWVEIHLDEAKARELSAVLGMMAGGAEIRRETG